MISRAQMIFDAKRQGHVPMQVSVQTSVKLEHRHLHYRDIKRNYAYGTSPETLCQQIKGGNCDEEERRGQRMFIMDDPCYRLWDDIIF